MGAASFMLVFAVSLSHSLQGNVPSEPSQHHGASYGTNPSLSQAIGGYMWLYVHAAAGRAQPCAVGSALAPVHQST